MKIKDKNIILFSLAFSLFCLAFFLYYSPDHPANELMVVAQFSNIQSDVKRKMVNSLDWENVTVNDEILANDLIYTGVKSSADIAYLSKKIKLKMQSSSILKIELEENKPTFNIQKGSLTIETDENVIFNIRNNLNIQNIKSNTPTKFNMSENGKYSHSPITNTQTPVLEVSKINLSKSKNLIHSNAYSEKEIEKMNKKYEVSQKEALTPENESIDFIRKRKSNLAFYTLIGTSLLILVFAFLG